MAGSTHRRAETRRDKRPRGAKEPLRVAPEDLLGELLDYKTAVKQR